MYTTLDVEVDVGMAVDLAQSESEAAPEPGRSSPTGSSWWTVICGGLSVVRSIALHRGRTPYSAPAPFRPARG